MPEKEFQSRLDEILNRALGEDTQPTLAQPARPDVTAPVERSTEPLPPVRTEALKRTRERVAPGPLGFSEVLLEERRIRAERGRTLPGLEPQTSGFQLSTEERQRAEDIVFPQRPERFLEASPLIQNQFLRRNMDEEGNRLLDELDRELDDFEAGEMGFGEVFKTAMTNLPASFGTNLMDTLRFFTPSGVAGLRDLMTELSLNQAQVIGGFHGATSTALFGDSEQRGAISLSISGESPQETPLADSVIDFYRNNYSDMSGFKRYVSEDPIGFLSDVATIISASKTATGLSTKAAKARVAAQTAKGLNANRFLSGVTKIDNAIQNGFYAVGSVPMVTPTAKVIRLLGEPERAIKAPLVVGRFIGEKGAKTVSKFLRGGEGAFIDPNMVAIAEKYGLIESAPIDALRTRGAPTGFEPKKIQESQELADALLKKNNRFGARIIEILDTSIKDIESAGASQIGNLKAGETLVESDKGRLGVATRRALDVYETAMESKIKSDLQPLGDLSKVDGSFANTQQIFSQIKGQESLSRLSTSEVADLEKMLAPALDPTKPVNLKEIDATRTDLRRQLQLHNRGSEKAIGDPGHVDKVYSALTEDLYESAKASPGGQPFADQLQKAKEAYFLGHQMLGKEYATQLMRIADAGEWHKITPMLYQKATSVDDVKNIYDLLGESGEFALKREVLQEIFTSSRNPNGSFNPEGIQKTLGELDDRIELIFWNDLNTVSELRQLGELASRGKATLEATPRGQFETVADLATGTTGEAGMFRRMTHFFDPKRGGFGAVAFLLALGGKQSVDQWLQTPAGQRFVMEGTPAGQSANRLSEWIAARDPNNIDPALRPLRLTGKALRIQKKAEDIKSRSGKVREIQRRAKAQRGGIGFPN